MLFSKLWSGSIDVKESMVFPDCYDVFNSYTDLFIEKNGVTTINLGITILSGLGEKCVLMDRYGYTVSHQIELENMALDDDTPVCAKFINRTNRDVIVPLGEILCQIMVFNIDMVGR